MCDKLGGLAIAVPKGALFEHNERRQLGDGRYRHPFGPADRQEKLLDALFVRRCGEKPAPIKDVRPGGRCAAVLVFTTPPTIEDPPRAKLAPGAGGRRYGGGAGWALHLPG